jgi:hypothetical protein
MPRRAAASFALLMLIVPASGGPPQPQQQLRSVPAVMIAIDGVPIVLLFIPHLCLKVCSPASGNRWRSCGEKSD